MLLILNESEEPLKMNEIPLIDWDGNGRIDPNDIALSLAIAEDIEEETDEEE